jgi:hypothetical protein
VKYRKTRCGYFVVSATTLICTVSYVNRLRRLAAGWMVELFETIESIESEMFGSFALIDK